MRIEVTGETEVTTEIDVNIDDVMNEWFARIDAELSDDSDVASI